MEHNQTLNEDMDTPPNIHSQQIKEEFYKWFESRGLLAELRAYMRQLMVKALEENKKNDKKKWPNKASISPKLQSINLLVVDYLFHEDYFYTVSVFASEASILESLPQYSHYVTESVKQHRRDPDSLPRFSRQETEDILDTLHIPPSPLQVRQTVDCYLAGSESLLACIVRTMVSVHVKSGNASVEAEDQSWCPADVEGNCRYQLWSQEMQQLLLVLGLKLSHIHRMEHKWAQTIEYERQQAKQEAAEGFAAREGEWRREVEERLQEEHAELHERQSRVEIQEQNLATLAEQLAEVHEDLNQRLSQLQLQSKQLEETAILQENERLLLQQNVTTQKEYLHNALSNKNEKPPKESNEDPVRKCKDLADLVLKEAYVQVVPDEEFGITISTQTLTSLATTSTQTVDVMVVASTQTVDDPQLLTQLEQARRKIRELQEENLELRAYNLQQRHRIEELTNRASNLTSQLEDSQVAVAVLSGRNSAIVSTAPTPPPPPPMVIAPTFGFRAPQGQGGGEESLFVLRPQQTTPRADGRRRPLRFAFSQQPSPTSEESSPTDEVIQNARVRIRQLEQESVSIQRNFQDFQTRLFTADSLMFPPLGASDPLRRCRLPAARLPGPPPPFDNFNRVTQNQHRCAEHEDSSSDLYDTRIESLMNSRRLFNQRNIRHFERWKQYKKKFQKRDGLDHRRNFKALNSNTSSDDDDFVDPRTQRRPDTNQTTRNFNTQTINSHIENTNEENHDFRASEVNKSKIISNKKISPEIKKAQKDDFFIPKPQLDNFSTEKVTNDLVVRRQSETEAKVEHDLERSAKLIKSVKILLEAQSIKESGATTSSNGSLAVESLPQDSINISPIDIAKTDSSVVTVQNVNTNKEITKELVVESCFTDQNTTDSPPQINTKLQSQSNSVSQEMYTLNTNQPADDKKNAYVQESHPEILSIVPESNIENEDLVSNFAITSTAEVESGERGTTSLTSGSDILRELNPSKTDSSSSVISVGFEENSKHSSDFWD